MSLLGKRFKLVDDFNQAKNHDYHLLPSRFAGLDDGRYLLSNEVGEYLVVDRPQLESYVRKSVDQNTDFYHDLKSKHFLFDDDSNVAIDLLALKYRTKALRTSQFTSLHIFVVTLRCDYTCQYCQVSRQTDDKHAFDMSEETANASFDLA